MKPETRGSFLTRSFRRSFKKKKTEDKEKSSSSGKSHEENVQNALSELRETIADVIQPRHNDIMLGRFLKAYKFNVKDTEKFLRLDVNLRRLLFLENFEDVSIPEVFQYIKRSCIIGYDKEGNLVRYVKGGRMDLKGMTHSVSTIGMIKLVLRLMAFDLAKLEEENKKTGKNGYQTLFIIDLEDLSTIQILHKPVLDSALMGLKLYQEHFYESWKDIYIINAPSYFSSVYKLLKPAMLEEFSSKVHIYSSDDYQETLLELIDADILPDFLGGSRNDYNNNDDISVTQKKDMDIVPESFYSAGEDFLDPDDPEVNSVTVAAGGFTNIPVPVIVPGSVIKYHVNSKDYDISFGVFYESAVSTCHIEKFKKKDDPKEILSKFEQLCPILRSQAHVTPEIGDVNAWKAGVYILHLDNTYSWMNAKTVCYKVEVKLPESEESSPVSSVIQSTKDIKL